ncbi:hypothetical protein HF325_006554, partial [Metschnikowia pulcherrima]
SAKGEGDTKLFKCGLVDIYKLDVLYLLPEEWLNDNNISFMYEMIVTHFLKEHDFGFHIQLLFPAITQLILHLPIEEVLQSILPMKDLAKLRQNFDDCGVFLIMFSCFLIAQLVSGEPTDLSVAHVKFNPLLARLKIMEIVYKLSQENNGQLEKQNKAFS